MKEEAIFHQALERPSADRAHYLNDACGEDTGLRERVEMLLEMHENPGSFLGSPVRAVDLGPTVHHAVTEEPGTKIGPYKLLQQIGEGGFGVVFVAEQEKPVSRKVALKIIKPGMDTKSVIARFEAERQALAMMDHPNIARIFDAGATESGRSFFAMELVHGLPITEFCDEQKLTNRERLKIMVDVCKAVQHAHQKGIIHRDLKPSNIMVTLDDDRPVPKVIDFGVSKALSGKLTDKTVYTAYGQMVGTPLYMAPEQAALTLLDVDTRSDVYSLGVLLYELLTGTTPFDRETLKNVGFEELRRMIREDEPPRPSARVSTLNAELATTSCDRRRIDRRSLGRSLRGELDWIVMKALEKDRNRRYESASAFAADIERYLEDEPVQACPPSVSYRFRKFARRKKATLAFSMLFALFLVTFVSAAGWVVRDRAARNEAAKQEREHQRQQLADRVAFVLQEVSDQKKAQKWDEAKQANRRAKALLNGVDGHWKLRGKIHQHEKELEFVDQLQQVREHRGITRGDANWQRQSTREATKYAALFREFGIDIADLTRKRAAKKLKQYAEILPAISVVLDDWAALRDSWLKDPKGAAALRLLANEIDRDPWRKKLRVALIAGDGEALKKLASSEDLLEQPPTSLLLLGSSLAPPWRDRRDTPAIDSDLGVNVLRKAQSRYPHDFWLNYHIGRLLMDYQAKEAIPYLQAAHSLRPNVYAAAHNLGVVWNRAGFYDQALIEFEALLHRHPNFWWAQMGIASVYAKQEKHEATVRYLKLALNSTRDKERIPELQYRIANSLQKLQFTEEAADWHRKAVDSLKVAIKDRYKEPEHVQAQRWAISTYSLFEILHDSSLGANVDIKPFLIELLEDNPESHLIKLWLSTAAGSFPSDNVSARERARRKRENLESARRQLESACRRNSRNYYLHKALDEVLTDLGEPVHAKFWKAPVTANLNEWRAHNQLIDRYREYARWDEAIQHLRGVFSLANSNQVKGHDTLLGEYCEILLECPKKNLREPAEAIRQLEKHKIKNRRVPLSLALAHLEQGNETTARKVLLDFKRENSWTESRPIKPPAYHDRLREHLLLTLVHWKLGEKREAMEWYLSTILPKEIPATELKVYTLSNEPFVGRRIPRVILQHDRDVTAMIPPEDIVSECTKQLSNGDEPTLYLARGEALSRLKKFDDAAVDFVKALAFVEVRKGWTAQQRVIYRRVAEFPEVTDRVAKLRPKDFFLWIEVGRFHAMYGRWQDATKAYAKGVERRRAYNTPLNGLRPGVEYAGVLLLSDDKVGYHQLCSQIMDRFEDPKIRYQLVTLTWAGILGEESGVKPAQLTEWAERAMSLVKRDGSQEAQILGLAHYRSGDFQKAIEALTDANAIRDMPLAVTAFSMAMAHYKLGEEKESRRWYDFAIRLHEADQPSYGMPCRQLHIDNWITENVLYQEAKALIEGKSLDAE